MNDLLSVASRRLIFECVTAHPGAHLRDVARRCALPLGTTLYHLDTLADASFVHARRDGRYKRYFTASAMGRRDKDVISVLRHETPRRIVQVLLDSEPLTQRELCDALGVSRSTLSFHAASLVTQGIIERIEVRPERKYSVLERDIVVDLFTRFGSSLEPTMAVPVSMPTLIAPVNAEVEVHA
ncbi:MAG: winged helix-turn-helix transcriptional regulator [Candidatus Thermoplasmatota archaeon]